MAFLLVTMPHKPKPNIYSGYTSANGIIENQRAYNSMSSSVAGRSGGRGTWITGRNWFVNIKQKINGKSKIVATVPNYFNEGDEDLITGALLSARNLDKECLTRHDLAKSGINFSPVISEGRSIARKDYEIFHADQSPSKSSI